MGYSHKRNIRASCEDCPQSGSPECSQVFDQRGGEPLIVRLIVIVVPGSCCLLVSHFATCTSFFLSSGRTSPR